MKGKDIALCVLLVLTIFNTYDNYQRNIHLNSTANPKNEPVVIEYCTWDRGHYTVAVKQNNIDTIKKTVAMLGKSIEGCV